MTENLIEKEFDFSLRMNAHLRDGRLSTLHNLNVNFCASRYDNLDIGLISVRLKNEYDLKV